MSPVTSISGTYNHTEHESNSATDVNDDYWRTGFLDKNIMPRVPDLDLPPKGTGKFRSISCNGELLSPNEVEEAQDFVHGKWERIYDKFCTLDIEDRLEMRDQNLVFMSFACIILNSDSVYKNAYEKFKSVSWAFDRTMDKHPFQRQYHFLNRLIDNLKIKKSYVKDLYRDPRVQAISEKWEETICAFDKIITPEQFNPDLHGQEIEKIKNCTQMVAECYADLRSLYLKRVEEGKESVGETVRLLNVMQLSIPLKLLELMLERRALWVGAVLHYYLTDPQFIKEKAGNEEKMKFYEAQKLINDPYETLYVALHNNDKFPMLMDEYMMLCRELSHPNHKLVQQSDNWVYEAAVKRLNTVKKPLFEAVEETRELLGIQNQNSAETAVQTLVELSKT